MKKNTRLMIIFIILLLIPTMVNAVGANLNIIKAEIVNKSNLIEVNNPKVSENKITSNIKFEEINDFVEYKITLKNDSNEKYKIIEVKDNNTNENIEVECKYLDKEIRSEETTSINVKIKYNKILKNVDNIKLQDIKITLKLKNEEGKQSEITINNPKTGDGIIRYVILFVASVIGILLVVKFKKKSIIGIFLIILMTPLMIMARQDIQTNISFSGIEIKGKFDIYNVEIDTDNGEEIKKEQVRHGDKVKKWPIAEKEGYKFIGWYDEEKNKIEEDTIVTKDMKLKAKYTPIEYTIKYNLDGGNAENKEKYTIEDEVEINNPEKEGYIFTGWSEEGKEGIKTKITIYKGTTGDKEYIAHYIIKKNNQEEEPQDNKPEENKTEEEKPQENIPEDKPQNDTPEENKPEENIPQETTYKVVHKKMNLQGQYEETETEELTGVIGTEVTPQVKQYKGFKSPEEKKIEIKEDGATKLEYLYEREKYTLTIEDSENVETETPSGKYYYETEIRLNAKEVDGKTFIKWSNERKEKEIIFNIVEDITIKPIYETNSAIFTKGNILNHKIEGLTNGKLEEIKSIKRSNTLPKEIEEQANIEVSEAEINEYYNQYLNRYTIEEVEIREIDGKKEYSSNGNVFITESEIEEELKDIYNQIGFGGYILEIKETNEKIYLVYEESIDKLEEVTEEIFKNKFEVIKSELKINKINEMLEEELGDKILSSQESKTPIYGWYDEENKTIYYYTNAGKVYFNEDSHGIFEECRELEDISGIKEIDSSKVKNIDSMFYNCKNIKKIDMSNYDFSNVITAEDMLYGTELLEEIVLPKEMMNNEENAVIELICKFYDKEEIEYNEINSKSKTKETIYKKYRLVIENEEFVETETPSGIYKPGTQIKLKAKEQEKYIFKRWSNNTNESETTFILNKDVTIKPVYIRQIGKLLGGFYFTEHCEELFYEYCEENQIDYDIDEYIKTFKRSNTLPDKIREMKNTDITVTEDEINEYIENNIYAISNVEILEENGKKIFNLIDDGWAISEEELQEEYLVEYMYDFYNGYFNSMEFILKDTNEKIFICYDYDGQYLAYLSEEEFTQLVTKILTYEKKKEIFGNYLLSSMDSYYDIYGWYNEEDRAIYFYSETEDIYMNENCEFFFEELGSYLNDLSEFKNINTSLIAYAVGMFDGVSEIEKLDFSNSDFSGLDSKIFNIIYGEDEEDFDKTENFFTDMDKLKEIITPKKLFKNEEINIKLPAPFIDEEGNVYFSINNKTPLKTRLTLQECAIFDTGYQVNRKMITVAGNKSNIQNIERSNVRPDDFIAEPNNIVSSDNSTYPIYIWYNEENKTIYYYTEAEKTYLNIDSSSMFKDMYSLKNMPNMLSVENIAGVKDMSGMFSNCQNIKEIDMSNLDLKNVTNTYNMIDNLVALEEIITPKAMPKDIIYLPKTFVDEKGNVYRQIDENTPTQIKLVVESTATFDTGNIVNQKMKIVSGSSNAYYETKNTNIKNIRQATNLLENFVPEVNNTISANNSNLPIYIWYEEESKTIYYYTKAEKVYLNQNLQYMFYGMNILEEISDIENISDTNITKVNYMFFNCTNIKRINLSNWDFSNLTYYTNNMFENNFSLKEIITPKKLFENENMTVPLIKTFYDKNGNEYTEINRNTPVKTKIEANKTATLDIGQTVNYKMKTVSGTTNASYYSSNTKIEQIKQNEQLPENFVAVADNTISSKTSNYPIYIWYSEPEKTIYYYTEAEKIYLNKNSSYMFYEMNKLKDIPNMLSIEDITNVEDISYMFKNCSSIEKADFSNLDLSNVTKANEMLNGMKILKEIITPKVMPKGKISLPKIFYDNEENEYESIESTTPTKTKLIVKSIAIFDQGVIVNEKMKIVSETPNAALYNLNTNIERIKQAEQLPENFVAIENNTISSNTSNYPIYIWYSSAEKTIYYYTEARKVYLNKYSLSMFIEMNGLKDISDIEKLEFIETPTVQNMFCDCTSIEKIDMSNWKFNASTNTTKMLYNTKALEEIITPNIEDNSVTISLPVRYIDEEDNLYTKIDNSIPAGTKLLNATGKVAKLDSGETVNKKIKEIAGNENASWSTTDTNIEKILRSETLPDGFVPSEENTISASDSSHPIYIWYEQETKTIYLYLEVVNFDLNENSKYLFSNLSNLINITGFSRCNMYPIPDIQCLFLNCKELIDINIFEKPGIYNVFYARSAFEGCTSLTDISALRNWDTSQIYTMESMFEGCTSLKDVNALENWNLSNVTTMKNMFKGCTNLRDIENLSKWNISDELKNIDYMFSDCINLEKLNMNNWNITYLNYSENMLKNTIKLKEVVTPRKGPAHASIKLPTYFYDSDGNSYTDIFNAPTQTLITVPNGAALEEGAKVNNKIKAMTGGGYNIQKILRSETMPLRFVPSEENTITVSNSRYPMYIWYDNESKTIYYYTEGEKIYLDKYPSDLFSGLTELKEIDGDWNAIDVYRGDGIFENCYKLEKIDLSGFNFKNAGFLDNMLKNNNALKEIITPIDVPKSNSIVIVLPATFVDEQGNEYTKIDSTTPKQTKLTRKTN